MLVCFRTIPCKLTSLGQRSKIVQRDRRLTSFMNTSASSHETKKISSRQLRNSEVFLTLSTCKSASSFKNTSIRSYSTVPKLSLKPIERSIEDKYSETQSKKSGNRNEGVSEDLKKVYKTLEHDLPRFFVASINYRIYHKDLEFVNNYKGITTKGINDYIKQVLYLRTFGHILYAYVKYDVLKITMNPEDNTVKVRWRIRGLSTIKLFTQFWKLKLFNITESMQRLESWHDGFSTYYMDSNGLVYKHVVDKMMPDDETIPAKNKPNIAAKLAA